METSLELKEYEARIEELRASEKLLASLNETLEMKLKKTEELRAQRLVNWLNGNACGDRLTCLK